MSRTTASNWTPMVCDTERDQKACLSWFGGLVSDEWGLPISAEMLENQATGGAKQLRAVFSLADGRFKQALRRFNKRNTIVEFKDIKMRWPFNAPIQRAALLNASQDESAAS